VLFTFPSRYWFAIGGQEYLALEGGPPEFPQGFSCPGVLGWQGRASSRSATGLSPSLAPRSKGVRVAKRFLTRCGAAAPTPCSHDPPAATPAGLTLKGFGLIRVRSPLLAESRLISLPRGTKMFQFPRFPCGLLRSFAHDGEDVAAFGDPRIKACSPLPVAFRWAPRPSSAPGPKASTSRPW
jgi:hypothetical protein